jgi:hypothetical protein
MNSKAKQKTSVASGAKSVTTIPVANINGSTLKLSSSDQGLPLKSGFRNKDQDQAASTKASNNLSCELPNNHNLNSTSVNLVSNNINFDSLPVERVDGLQANQKETSVARKNHFQKQDDWLKKTNKERLQDSLIFLANVKDEVFDLEYCRTSSDIQKQKLNIPLIYQTNPLYSNLFKLFLNKDNYYDCRINISEWLPYVNEELLRRISNKFKRISLVLKDIFAPLSSEVCQMISNTFATKINELIIINCPHIQWNVEIKAILLKCENLQSLELNQLKWLNDNNLELIAKRYKISLEKLVLERCSSISNTGLFNIGKYCSQIRQFHVICCNKLSDLGLNEVSKKNHLKDIYFSHSLAISDKGIESLMVNSLDLDHFEIVNCPNLTNKTVSYLYEVTASWGKRRNTEAATLSKLIVRDNVNITEESLLWVTTSSRELVEIDLRECPNIEFGKAILEMAHLTQLRYLRLGTFNLEEGLGKGGSKGFRFKLDYFLQGLKQLIPQLLVLQLINIDDIRDEHMADLLDDAFSLTELSLVKLSDIGTNTIESICSNIPNISRLEISYSKALRDIDLRCLSSVLFHIKYIKINHCPLISDAGFTRFVALRHLEELDIDFISPQVTSNVVKYLTLSPLKKICLAGITHKDEQVVVRAPSGARKGESSANHIPMNTGVGCNLQFLRPQTRHQLSEINLSSAKNLSVEDVRLILNSFVFCERLELSDMPSLNADVLSGIKHCNPFLEFTMNASFVGFSLSPSGRLAYNRYYAIIRQLQRHTAVRRIQKLRRRYLERIDDLKDLKKENWKFYKNYQIVKIQAVMRSFLARKQVRPKLNAGRTIVRYARRYLYLQGSLKMYRAKLFYKRQLMKFSFMKIGNNRLNSKDCLSALESQVGTMNGLWLLRKYFKLCQIMKKEIRELHFEESAMIIYHINFLRKILKHWRQIFEDPELSKERDIVRKQKLVAIFLNAIDNPKMLNSSRQKPLVSAAMNFHRKRLLMISWMVLAKDRLERRRVDKLVPLAISFSEKKFFKRVVTACFSAVKGYYFRRLLSYRRKSLADKLYLVVLKRRYLRRGQLYLARRKFLRLAFDRSKNSFKDFFLKLALRERFYYYTMNTVRYKFQAIRSKQFRNDYIFETGYFTLKAGILRDRKWREMNKVAENRLRELTLRRAYKGWDFFRKYSKNMDIVFYKRYVMKICKQAFFGFKLNVAMSKDFLEILNTRLKEKAKDPNHLLKLVLAIRRFQAAARGRMMRKKFEVEKIEKLYAIQTLQNFFRVVKARKEYMRRVKLLEISEKVREDEELDRMREEEIATRYFLYHENAILDIQRCFRGYLGRRKAKARAVEYFREKHRKDFEENDHIRQHHDAFLKALAAKEKIRHNAAVEIQRIVRGRNGRRRAAILQYQRKISLHAVDVQRAYKRRLAKMELLARKRDVLSDMRYKAARRQRGLVLRLFGLTKRKYQKIFAPMLEGLGVDPISFNYRVGELVTETIQDFEALLGIYIRERELLKKHGTNTLGKMLERRTILGEQGWEYKLHDAVRIVEPGHPFHGYSGVISRIDESLVGTPLFEVRLDRFPRQTYVRQTTDPLVTYQGLQPLAKIQKDPKYPMHNPFLYPAIFGLDGTNDFYCKKNVYAACTIQRAFRVYRSGRIVARVRYEHWRKCINRQHSLLHHLAETNSLSGHGYDVTELLGVRSFRPIFFDEIRHKFIPQKYISRSKQLDEAKVIAKEIESRIKDRMTFLQKAALMQLKDPFTLGFRRMTYGRKINLFFKQSYGMLMNGGASVRDLFGKRSLAYMANKRSSVVGFDKYTFHQFQNSNHIRYNKTSLYQGEWSGVPLFTRLKPHGEGMIIFLDGWGFAREDKVLYLTIIRCRYLNAVEFDSSDPFCDIFCNTANLQTTIKWKNLNPEYHESFEIDVTNPQAELRIVVKSKDVFTNFFLGQIRLKLSDYVDGKEHHITQLLKGEDMSKNEDFDRGEIELRLRWSERIFEDDQLKLEQQHRMLLRLQAWARRIAALMILKSLRKERELNLAHVRKCAVKITCLCRIRLARKVFKRLNRKHK